MVFILLSTNIIKIHEKLLYLIQFESLLIFLDLLMAYSDIRLRNLKCE
jgi:hypothetical protein